MEWRTFLSVHTMEPENVASIAISFVKIRKQVDAVNITATEQKNGVWVVKGTCPIDLGGHPWTESFEVIVDRKGKIKSSTFNLI